MVLRNKSETNSSLVMRYRYALMNQERIKNSLGEEYLKNHLVASLDSLFSFDLNLEELIEMSEPLAVNDRYDFITANDVADEDDMLLFAIIGITYDVVKLAYVSRIKG